METPTDLVNNNLYNNSLYNLSIRICLDGFSLYVYDQSKVLISFKNVAALLFSLSSEEIFKLLTEETLLNYKSVRLICESENYTFIPTLFFKSEEAIDYIQFQAKLPKSDQVIINRIPAWDTVNVFSIPKTLFSAITHVYPNAIIEHHISYFLSEWVKLQTDSIVYNWVRSNIMDIVVISNGALKLINSYKFITSEDFTYHTLDLYDKLSLDIENCKVVLFNTDKKPELQKTLEKYVTVIVGS